MKLITRMLLMMLVLLMGTGMTSCEFFNDNPVSPRLKVRASSMTVQVGASRKCNVSASTRARLLYASNNEAIATVDEKGLVTGVSEGDAVITVVATNQEGSELFLDESAVIAVKVVSKDTKVDEEDEEPTELTPEQIAETQQQLNMVMTQEGARISFSFSYDGIDYEATFEHQGEDYPLVDFTSSKASTMAEALKLAPFTPILTTFTPSDEEVDDGDGEIQVFIENEEPSASARKAETRGEEKFGYDHFLVTLEAADGSALAQIEIAYKDGKCVIRGDEDNKLKVKNIKAANQENVPQELKIVLNPNQGGDDKGVMMKSIKLSYNNANLAVGKEMVIKINYSPTNALIHAIYWKSDNKDVATVSLNGIDKLSVKALGIRSGIAKITAYAGNKKASFSLNVFTPLDSVRLDQKTLKLKPNDSFKFTPTYYPVDAEIKEKTWYSSNPNVVSVTNLGVLKAQKTGKATIIYTVSDYTDSKSDTCEVTVSEDEALSTMMVQASDYSGTYDKKEHGIKVNVTKPASGYTIRYGKEEGTYNRSSLKYTDAGEYTVYYQVTCTGYEPATGSAKVVISKANAEISFKNSSETKTYGDEKFTNTLTNSGDGTVKYSSDKTSVAVVNESSGEVEIKGVGTATITAAVSGAKNYQYAKDKIAYTLTVNPKGTISDYDKKDSQDW